MNSNYDLIVIGGGSGGVRAARIAASHGAKVAICEEFRYGGTCVIRGCVPKKLMVYAAHFREEFADSEGFGWQSDNAKFDWTQFIANKDEEIDRLNKIYEEILENHNVERYYGRAELASANEVLINAGQAEEQRLSAEKILVATGAHPFVPDIVGADLAITSNEIFDLKSQPESIAIVGGGYIAVEFAGIMHGLGSEVHLLYRGPQVLRGFDQDVRSHLGQEMTKKGVDVRTNCQVVKLERSTSNDKTSVHLDDKNVIEVDCVLYATGRRPNSHDLGLENAGVKVGDADEIIVDEASQTNTPNIYAVGDVTNRIALTPVAIREGHAFADTCFGDNPWVADHSNVASAVFSQPPIGTVGLSEEEASAQFKNIDTYSSRFRHMKHALTDNQEQCLIKLVVDADSDKVLGAHMVGGDAAEIIQGIAIAIKMGARKADFDRTVGIHPTAAEEFCTLRVKDAD